MIDCNTSTDILYEKSTKQSYISPTYHSTHRVFVPDLLLNKPKLKFIPDPLSVVPRDRIELPSLLCKSKALPLDERGLG
jgi:hypothetical protein